MLTKTLNLVLEGGGVKGIALIGALSAAEAKGLTFQGLAGTSAGSMVAALYAAGYSAKELETTLINTDFSSLLDPIRPSWYGLWKYYGIYEGRKFYEWIYLLLKKMGVVTFSDIKDRELKIIASDLTNRSILTFDNVNNPKMSIAEAVRMSISIPLFFKACRYGESLVVDGGILSNYPLWVFQDSKADTIGFKLVSDKQANVPAPPKSFSQYLISIISTMMEAHDKEDARNPSFGNTIHIPTGSIPTTKFNLSEDEKASLVNSGFRHVTEYVTKYSDRFPQNVSMRKKHIEEIRVETPEGPNWIWIEKDQEP